MERGTPSEMRIDVNMNAKAAENAHDEMREKAAADPRRNATEDAERNAKCNGGWSAR